MNHKQALAIVQANNINLAAKTAKLCTAYKEGSVSLEQILNALETYMSPIEAWENDPVERWVNDCALWSFYAAQKPTTVYKAIANLFLLEAFTSL